MRARSWCAAVAVTLFACSPPVAEHPKAARAARVPPVPAICTDVSKYGVGVSWSADGAALLVACNGALELRDAATGTVLAQRSIDGEPSNVLLNRDASLVAIPRPGGLELRRGKDLSLQSVIVLDASNPAEPALAFSPDDTRVALLIGMRSLLEVSAADGRVLRRVDDAVDPKRQASSLHYVGDDIAISTWRAAPVVVSGSAIAHPRWAREATGYLVSPIASEIALDAGRGTTTLWDLASDRPIRTLKHSSSSSRRWLGPYFATEAWGQSLDLTPVAGTGETLHLPRVGVLVSSVTADGRHLRTITATGLVDWELPSLAVRQLAWRSASQSEFYQGGFVLERESKRLTLRRQSDRRVVASMRLRGSLGTEHGTWVSERGEIIELESRDSDGSTFLRIAGNGPERTFELMSFDWQVFTDPVQPRLVLIGGGTIHVFDSGSLAQVASLPDPEDREEVAFASAKHQLVILHRSGKLSFVDLETGRVAATASLPEGDSQFVVSPDGEHIGARSRNGGLDLWTHGRFENLPLDDLRSYAFSADSQELRWLSLNKLTRLDAATHRTLGQEKWPDNPSTWLVGDTVLTTVGYGLTAARPVGAAKWQSVNPVAPTQVALVGFRAGSLELFDHRGAFLRWRLGELATESPIRVARGKSALLSPAGTQLSIDGDAGVTVDLQTDNQSRSPGVTAWSLDGRAVLSYGDVLASDGATPRVRVHGVAFAGSSESVLAQQNDELLLVDTRKPDAPRTLAEHARLRAQSADQSTIAISSDYDRKLAVLRAPSWQALGAPALTNGVQRAAFSANGDRLALLDENNQLEVRPVSASGVGAAVGRYSLPPAPGVSALLFDPSGRFLILEGTPLRFLRLSDAQILNLYVGSLDHFDRLEAPLLFVNQQGEMEGDSRLASELYCDSAADADWSGTRPPCELPHTALGLVNRFFFGE